MLRGASFDGTDELVAASEAFIKHYNETAEPFAWKKREVKGTRRYEVLCLIYAVRHWKESNRRPFWPDLCRGQDVSPPPGFHSFYGGAEREDWKGIRSVKETR